MKIVFLWNESSLNYIKSFNIDNENREFITNKQDFNNFDLEGLSFLNIIILVELDWEKDSLFNGYAVANGIIKNWKNDAIPPNIRFVSFVSRLSLFEINDDINKFYSKSFIHYQLPLKEDFSTYSFSSSKFKYLKKYALTKSGILDIILHDLKNTTLEPNCNYKEEYNNYCKRLEGIKDIIGENLSKFIKEAGNNYKDNLNNIRPIIANRIRELDALKNKSTKTYNGVKEKIILLEDNPDFGQKIKSALDIYFDVDYYNKGHKAIEAIKNNGIICQALVTDLELLNADKKLDQPVQGVEVFEYAQENYPHIVRRVVSGLPRNGIKELINIDINDVLYKSLIVYHGFTDGFEDWVKKLKEDIYLHKELKYMKGPNNVFWNDEGAGFKRFYYNFMIEDKKKFDEMWRRIYAKVHCILKDSNEISNRCPDKNKISTEFKKITDASNLLSKLEEGKIVKEKIIELLKKILTHRLLWISFFNDGATVIYKDNINPKNSFSHKPFWKGNLPPQPTALFKWLGFSSKAVFPKKKPNIITPYVSIVFKYNSLFKKEEEFRVKNDKLLKSEISDFSNNYSSLCKMFLDFSKVLYKEKNTIKEKSYLDFSEIDVSTILVYIKTNNDKITRGTKNLISDTIIEFMETDDFKKIPSNISKSLEDIIGNNILN